MAMGHPIVGDGKYGGRDAFLTGTISRKMHLHARRLIIDSPKGGKIDVTAELPEHFAASMEQLGFDEGVSDAAPTKGRAPPNREEKKQAARAHAKQVRKGRRGERRSRAPEKPDTGPDKPSRGTGKPARGADRPVRGTDKPARGAGRSARDTDRPARSADKPPRGAGKPARTGDKPPRGPEKPERGKR
jgi:23S rRNA pseudouridine955/2504/2580 synthase